MTFRGREEILDASEEYSHCQNQGSFLFCLPSEDEHWCLSPSFGNLTPLTPPDTASDCSGPEYSDMADGQSQTSMPEDLWTASHGPDRSSLTQSSGSAWSHGVIPGTNHDLYSTEESNAWLSVTNGSVDLGLSPVLSYTSQSMHSLNSLPESDLATLPLSLDLSFAADPGWNGDLPVTYTEAEEYQHVHPVPEENFGSPVVSKGPYMEFEPNYTSTEIDCVGTHQPFMVHHGGHMTNPGQVQYANPVASTRTLLPRTGHAVASVEPTYGQYRALRPNNSMSQSSRPSMFVSNSYGQPSGVPHQTPVCSDGHTSSSSAAQGGTHASVAVSETSSMHEADLLSVNQAIYHGTNSVEDFSDFLHFDHDDSSNPRGPISDSRGYKIGNTEQLTSVAGSSTSVKREYNPKLAKMTPKLRTASGSSDTDEGRYRTHPLYTQGPKADGLYHCPFAGEPGCQHKPNKLKCNYDKFIDSHLKPFRCKMTNCSNQEFSSTACLLRHEREAHGMHGHGDRPNLCYYPGCDRSLPGNGFPRRYNLFDHMKRVHDYKDDGEVTSRTGSPDRTTERWKPMARKRKASSSQVDGEPSTKSKKAATVTTQS